MKLQLDTTTLLPLEFKAPPLAFIFQQFMKTTPVKATVELTILKAVPDACKRSLQLKMVADGTPMMTSDEIFLMLIVGSLKTPVANVSPEALITCMA
jgi:hypothetical protein